MRFSTPHIYPSLALVLMTALLSLALVTPAAAGKPGPGSVYKRVCIDAGHGGNDPGASYGSLVEKNLTHEIASKLKVLLEAANAGYSVVLTRPGDESLGNTERATICNNQQADVVLSIHLNAAPSDQSIDYFQAFYGKQIKDAAWTQTIWNNYNLALPNSTTQLPKHATTQFASGLLLKTNAPACLAETVFLSNPAEQAVLGDGTGNRQQAIAQNLFNGIVAWYQNH
jgi:N-acetylmuramoyl-L-alanine amidase